MVSADTLLWQVSIDHNMDFQYQRKDAINQGCTGLCYSISCNMVSILRDSVVVASCVGAHEQYR